MASLVLRNNDGIIISFKEIESLKRVEDGGRRNSTIIYVLITIIY